MGSATDGFIQPLGTYLTAPGMPGPAGPISGSATDGPRIAPIGYYPAAPSLPAHGWWDTPAAAPAPAPGPEPAPAPAPDPTPAPGPVDTGPVINPIGPGRALTPQPTVLGNALGNAVLNPPQQFWVGGQDSYDKSRRTAGSGSLRTTQT
jgi:hypothetical protein